MLVMRRIVPACEKRILSVKMIVAVALQIFSFPIFCGSKMTPVFKINDKFKKILFFLNRENFRNNSFKLLVKPGYSLGDAFSHSHYFVKERMRFKILSDSCRSLSQYFHSIYSSWKETSALSGSPSFSSWFKAQPYLSSNFAIFCRARSVLFCNSFTLKETPSLIIASCSFSGNFFNMDRKLFFPFCLCNETDMVSSFSINVSTKAVFLSNGAKEEGV